MSDRHYLGLVFLLAVAGAAAGGGWAQIACAAIVVVAVAPFVLDEYGRLEDEPEAWMDPQGGVHPGTDWKRSEDAG